MQDFSRDSLLVVLYGVIVLSDTCWLLCLVSSRIVLTSTEPTVHTCGSVAAESEI